MDDSRALADLRRFRAVDRPLFEANPALVHVAEHFYVLHRADRFGLGEFVRRHLERTLLAPKPLRGAGRDHACHPAAGRAGRPRAGRRSHQG